MDSKIKDCIEPHDCREQEQSEMTLVAITDAVVDPRTVVVHLEHTSLTPATVVGAGRLITDTLTTILNIFTIFWVFRLPLQRHQTGTNEDSAKEIVEYYSYE